MSPKTTRRKSDVRQDLSEKLVEGEEQVDQESVQRASSESTAKSPALATQATVGEDEDEDKEGTGVDDKGKGKAGASAVVVPVLDSILTYPAGATVEVVDRIDGVVAFVDHNAPRYGIGVVPTQSRWGTCGPRRRSDIDAYMCTKNKAFAVWMVGKAHFIQLGATEDSHVVTVEPLSKAHLEISHKVQFERASPATTPPANGLVCASRRNQDRINFEQAYDATEHLLPWSRMQKDKIDATKIEKKDTVLVEAYVRRTKTDTGPKGKWSKWTVSFELERVAVLARVPVPMELPPDSEVNL